MSTSNVIISNTDTMCMFDSWFSFNRSSEENIASRVGTQNLLAEQAADRAKSTGKKLELAGYEYHKKKTNARNIDSFTPQEKAQTTCQESIKYFRKSAAREEAIKKSHRMATDTKSMFDFFVRIEFRRYER